MSNTKIKICGIWVKVNNQTELITSPSRFLRGDFNGENYDVSLSEQQIKYGVIWLSKIDLY